MSRSWLVYDLVASNPDLLDPSNEPWPGGTQHQLSTVGIELARISMQLFRPHGLAATGLVN